MAKIIPSSVTFERASDGTYHSDTGLVTTVASGVARFDYDPTTLAYSGLLIEDETTNICPRSIDYPNWDDLNVTVAADAAASPSGQQDADSITGSGVGSIFHYVNSPNSSAVAINTEQSYTWSIYAKADTHDIISMRISLDNSGSVYTTFDLTNGLAKVGGISTAADQARIVAYPNGWYRCEMVFTTGASDTTADPYVYLVDQYASPNGAYDATGDSVFLWGSQIEDGSLATSFIYTEAAQVTREKDVVYIDLDQAGINYNNDKSSIIIEYSGRFDNTQTGFPAAWFLTNNADNAQRILLRVTEGTETIGMSVTTNGTSYISNEQSITYPNFGGKHAARFRTDDIQVSRDGVIDLSRPYGGATTETQPTVIVSPDSERDRLFIGCQPANNGNRLNGHVKSIKYYNKPLPNKRLIALST